MIDSANAKLLVAFDDALLRCELDGTACTSLPFSGSRAGAFHDSRALIDTTNSKLLVVTSGGSGSSRTNDEEVVDGGSGPRQALFTVSCLP